VIRVEDRPALYPRAVGSVSDPFRPVDQEKQMLAKKIPLNLVLSALLGGACATSPPPGTHPQMGTLTNMSAASTANWERCPHGVPKEKCTLCNPSLVATFKSAGDWCPMHGVPESQCFKCHPDLSFDPLPPLPPGADLVELSKQGEDVPSLESHAVRGKVTLFDFYAIWCGPCRKLDAHVFPLLGQRGDLAVRKLNMVDWETPIAARYLKDIPGLPYVVVYGKDGKRVKAVSGLDLPALDRAIAEASGR
jgi:thiol-disulfide isomerase/thioredoxin